MVLVFSIDSTMARLLKLNLERRGFEVQLHAWAACCGLGEMPRPGRADMLIADLHCPAPACWEAGPRLRTAFPGSPLLLLAHEHPSLGYLRAHEPCRCLLKPFGVTEAIREVETITTSAR